MVFRLFVPPGEGQDNLIPRRPDPIGANATLQYTVLASTGLAAAYTSLAASHQQRVGPQTSVSRTALFIRSSARFGIWAGALGAATNWYYYSAFASVAASKIVPDMKPWKLYEWTKTLTVEDGCLAGAALGAVASIPTLFMRRPTIPRWTQCVGMTHIGACAGISGAHGYFQYTGERQEAYQSLERRMKRKHLELWAIFWDKELMAQFNPIMQQYVRNNGIWHASLLPDSAFQRPNDRSLPVPEHQSLAPDLEATPTTESTGEDKPYYFRPLDYAEELRNIDVPATVLEIEQLELEKAALLAEAELLLSINTAQQYRYCHSSRMDDESRRDRLQEMFVLEITYTRLQRFAHAIDEKLLKFRLALQHRAIWSGFADSNDGLPDWLPKLIHSTQVSIIKPHAAIRELEDLRRAVGEEVKRLEEWSNDPEFDQARREKWRKDLEDGRCLLRGVDAGILALDQHRRWVEESERNANRKVEGQNQIQNHTVVNGEQEGDAELLKRKAGCTASIGTASEDEQTQAPVAPKTATKSSNDGLDSKGS